MPAVYPVRDDYRIAMACVALCRWTTRIRTISKALSSFLAMPIFAPRR
jgi:hypothetical protein